MSVNGTNGVDIQHLREQVEAAELTLRKRLLESQINWTDQYIDPREMLFDADDFWLPIGYQEQVPWNLDRQKKGEALPVYISEHGLKMVRDISRHVCTNNEFAINGVENRCSYIVGKGFTYRAVLRNDDPRTPENERGTAKHPLARKVQAVIDEFHDRSAWGELEQELVQRADVDGEWFLRFFVREEGFTDVRVVEPEHVKTPPGSYPDPRAVMFGVETEPLDVERVLAYHVVEDPQVNVARERVPAKEIVHLKLNVPRSAKRGLPTFFPVRKNLDRAEKLLRNMSLMAQIQATFAVIRKHKGFSLAQLQAFQQSEADVQASSALTGRTQYIKQYAPGSVIDAPESTEYQFPGGEVNTPAFTQVLQAELRAIGARLQMPEYMLSGDSSASNYASTLVAESPFVKGMERLQAMFSRKLGRGVFRRGTHRGAMWIVILNAVRAGRLPRQVLHEIELQVEGPSLIVRDRVQEAQRNQTLAMNKVLSIQTWCQQEGLDYDREQANIEEHEERTGQGQQGGPDAGGMGGGGEPPPGQGGDGGLDDLLASLGGGGAEGDEQGSPPASMAAPGLESLTEALESAQRVLRKAVVAQASGRGNVRALTEARGRYRRLAARVLESGFTGTIRDSAGRERHYVDGKQVAGQHEQYLAAATAATSERAELARRIAAASRQVAGKVAAKPAEAPAKKPAAAPPASQKIEMHNGDRIQVQANPSAEQLAQMLAKAPKQGAPIKGLVSNGHAYVFDARIPSERPDREGVHQEFAHHDVAWAMGRDVLSGYSFKDSFRVGFENGKPKVEPYDDKSEAVSEYAAKIAKEAEGMAGGESTGIGKYAKLGPNGRRWTAAGPDTTNEGVPIKEAKNLTRDQAREAIRFHGGMNVVGGSNVPNPALPHQSRPELSETQRGAIQKFSYQHSEPLNKMLRRESKWFKFEDSPYSLNFYQELHAQLESAFAAAEPFPKPLPVVRGLKLSPEQAKAFAEKLQASMDSGEPVSYDGYMKTTKPGGLMYLLGMSSGMPADQRGNVTLKINATHGLDMKPHSQLSTEDGLLLPHGAKFRVVNLQLRRDGIHATLEQIPPQKDQAGG